MAEVRPELQSMLESMRRVVVSSERLRTRAAEHLGLALGEVIILSLVGYPDPLTPTELAVALGRNASTITAAIDRLEAAGMIERRPHPRDRRKTVLVMAPEGERAISWLRSFSVRAFDKHDTATLVGMTNAFENAALAIETQGRLLDAEPYRRATPPRAAEAPVRPL